MAATEYNFPIEQGSSFRLLLTYKDSNGEVIDLSGYCARLTMKVGGQEFKTLNQFLKNENRIHYYIPSF